VPTVNDHPSRAGALLCLLLSSACSGHKSSAPAAKPAPAPERSFAKRADVIDDCAQVPGQPPPAPLRTEYTGVAKAARCDREVFTIMGGVTHFLGVECKHCHLEPDYIADTHNKRIANWMARELVPRLELRSGKDVWCRDCHTGRAKFLGNPRRADFAVDWMLTHMVEDFQTKRGLPPKCKDCHGGDLGSPEFRPKIILTSIAGSSLPVPPATAPATATAPAAAPDPTPAAAPTPATAPAPAAPPPATAPAAPTPVPSAQPIPDFGGR
jgi:hypothetical protein